MYLAYKIINGVLHAQSMPNGPWKPMSAEQIAARLAEVESNHSRALLEAHQCGRREGMEEVSPLLERLRHWIEDEVGAELPFTADEQDAFYALRAKMEEQP